MKRKSISKTTTLIVLFYLILALLLPSGSVGAFRFYPPSSRAAATTITVTSTEDDYNDGKSKTCLTASPCTLRRAVNQAYVLSSDNSPVTIEFNIPTSDTGYDNTLGVWKIQLSGSPLYDLRELNTKTILDGSTQPGGRTGGPKIIIDGLGNHNHGFILRNGSNEVRGLGMQDFKKTHITVSSDGNVIEDSWFGLSDDGTSLSSGDDTDPEGGSGVVLSAGVDGNTIRDNVFAGFFGAAVAINGDNNVFTGNYVGTRADGTVPIPSQFNQHPCLAGAWVGGSGITVAGTNNQIGGVNTSDGNTFAGLFLDLSPTSTQSPAIDVSQSGGGTIIQKNIIGLDANEDVIGVCGRGLDFGSGPQDMQVIDNTITETGLSAILMNGSSLNGNTLRGNIIKRATSWPGEQGFNDFKEDAIAFGPYVPDALRTFKPARVTKIDGTTVNGTSGVGSPCANCVIEVFLDDTDAITETLQSLAVETADGSGNWTASLSAPLVDGQGLRTTSTVPDTFTIISLDTGTTSNLSELYVVEYKLFLPLVIK